MTEKQQYLTLPFDGDLCTRQFVEIAVNGVREIAPEELGHEPDISVKYTDKEAIIYSPNPMDYYLIGINMGMIIEKQFQMGN